MTERHLQDKKCLTLGNFTINLMILCWVVFAMTFMKTRKAQHRKPVTTICRTVLQKASQFYFRRNRHIFVKLFLTNCHTRSFMRLNFEISYFFLIFIQIIMASSITNQQPAPEIKSLWSVPHHFIAKNSFFQSFSTLVSLLMLHDTIFQ